MLKKKGRKPKSYYENLKKENIDNSNNIIDNSYNVSNNNIIDNSYNVSNNSDISSNIDISNGVLPEKINKKRGRKPKGGKIIEVKNVLQSVIPSHNIILHLNCKLNEIYDNNIKYVPDLLNINNYDIDKNNNLKFNYINNSNIINTSNNNNNNNNDNNNDNDNDSITNNNNNNDNDNDSITNNNNNNNKDIDTNNVSNYAYSTTSENKTIEDINDINNKLARDKDIKNSNKNITEKLKELSYNFKHNNINKKSACFWCTCTFNNETIYIPKYVISQKYICYGSFCSPECACSYLMNENIDTSSKFERYHLLNNIYGKIYDYNKNIKPAPSPYYLLDKFYGNMEIQEYRKLLKNERLLLVIDKPLSQTLPEIYQENEDYLISSKIMSKNINKNNIK
jgi:hypothetical protein